MKRILSLLLALIMIVGTITPVMAQNVQGNDPLKKKDGPEQIKVNIHKILMSKEELDAHGQKTNDQKKYEPSKGIQDLASHFGNTAKEIDKVFFVAIKEGEEGYNDFDTKSNDEKDQIINALGTGRSGLTTANGLALMLENPGKYKIYEVKHKSTYTGDKDEILAEQLAVPVELILPDHARTETGVANEIHVYPKNTEDGPTVDKKIKNEAGDEVKTATFDKTKEHTWVIEADIPTGVKDYKLFTLEDNLQQALSYVQGQTVKVTVTGGTVTLTDTTDYVVKAPTETEGGKLTVALTEEGIKKLAGAEGQKVRVEFNTTINDNAVMSKDIPNDVTLKYGHDPNSNLTKKPEEPPKVYTGGKKFKKIDSSKGNTTLSGAEFVIRNENNEYLFEENGKYVWKTTTKTEPKEIGTEENIKKITSGQDGLFEIKGLKYVRPNGTKYILVEVKAPEGYALPTNSFEFTVNDTSYNTNPTGIETNAGDATPLDVDNKPITIPQTGGIGTVIFTVVGVTLMAGAVIAMRRNREAN